MEYFSTIRQDNVMQFVAMWIDLESIMLCEIYQRERNMLRMTFHMWDLKKLS